MSESSTAQEVPKLAKAGPRIDSLDLLRGIAILGIFLMNTWTMSLPQGAYTNPSSYNPSWVLGFGFPDGSDALTGEQYYNTIGEPLTGANRLAYILIHLFADMKFITTFSILFGAGIVLQADRARKTGRNPWLTHYLRMIVLLFFGLCHTFFFWYGDILTDYALLGMLLAPLRKLPGVVLVILGLALVSADAGFDSLVVRHLQIRGQADSAAKEPLWSKAIGSIYRVENQLNNRSQGAWMRNLNKQGLDAASYPNPQDREIQVYRSGWWDQVVGHRFWCSVKAHTTGFLTWTLFRCGGCLLIGMGLQRLRFFHGAWRWWSYALIALALTPLGWWITWRGVLYNEFEIKWSEDWFVYESLWHKGVKFNYFGSLLCAFGYISVGVLLAMVAANPARKLFRACLVPIRSVGRMALTCYLTESLIGTTLFYGHGFGYFGMFSRAELPFKVVLPTWIAILAFATLWLTFFRQGPLEWLWHSIVYWDFKNPLKSAAGPDASLSPSVQGSVATRGDPAV